MSSSTTSASPCIKSASSEQASPVDVEPVSAAEPSQSAIAAIFHGLNCGLSLGDLHLATYVILFYIAKNPSCTAAELVKNLHLAQPAVTRHLQRLTTGSKSAAVGAALALAVANPEAKRAKHKRYNLSAGGRAFIEAIVRRAPDLSGADSAMLELTSVGVDAAQLQVPPKGKDALGGWLAIESKKLGFLLVYRRVSKDSYIIAVANEELAGLLSVEFALTLTSSASSSFFVLSGALDFLTINRMLVRIDEILSVSLITEAILQAESKEDSISEQACRAGQAKYRHRLMLYWGARCPISGSALQSSLRASHIKRREACDLTERSDPYNGLLLECRYDALFDAGAISFDEIGKIIISPSLPEAECVRLGLTGFEQVPGLTPRHQQYLQWHRTHRLKPR